ncbi:MAG: hypothetical protein ACOYMN_04120 [Roseimicrobium sp.]
MQLLRALLLAFTVVLTVPSCVYFGVNAPAVPAPGTQVRWPGRAFTEVRAYCYDYTAEKKRSFFIEGRMHQGVMDPAGVKLTPPQVRRLMKMLAVSHDKQARTPCYKPHHAFVFYGPQHEVVAVFEMCFGCNQFVETPEGLPEHVDTAGLQGLVQELGLPFGVGNAFYTEACGRGQAKVGR